MNFKNIFSLAFQIGAALVATNLKAQSPDSTFTDRNFAEASYVWLSSTNNAGLTTYQLGQTANADLFFSKGNGNFKNYHQTNNSFTYGLAGNSIYRYNNHVVFKGGFTYENFKGKNMGGSAFINPYLNAFNLVEMDEANKGTKTKETYHLNAAVGAQLNQDFSIGGGFNYTAANFAKQRDLRHVNKLGDIDADLGLKYDLSKKLSLGASYAYNKSVESIVFRRFGNTDRIYFTLIDFGSFIGRNENFNDYGYTASGATTPYVNYGHQAALQIATKLNKNTSWINELSYQTYDGYFGEQGSSSTQYTQHQGYKIGYSASVNVNKNNNLHTLRIKAKLNNLTNSENIYLAQTELGSVTRIVYYGANEVFTKSQFNASAGYTLYQNISNTIPNFVLNANIDVFIHEQHTNLYPFYRKQSVNSYQAFVSGKQNIKATHGLYSATLGVGYGSGGGTVKEDGTIITPTASQVLPTTNDQLLNQEFEYLTSSRGSAMLELQYTKTLNNKIMPYAKLGYTYTHAFKTNYIKPTFGLAQLSIGYNF